MSIDGLNGITVGGKPVAKYIVEKEVEKKTMEAQADFDQKKSRSRKGLENYPKTRIKSKNTSKSGSATFLPRRQINREYWRNNMDTSSIVKMIIAILLKGEKYTIIDVFKIIKTEIGSTADSAMKYTKIRKSDISSRFSHMKKSELGALMIKENISATSRPVYMWSFCSGALDMLPEELIGLYRKRSNDYTLFKLTDKYPWISTWLKEIKWAEVHTPKKAVLPHKKDKTTISNKINEDTIVKVIATDEGAKTITDLIEDAISSTLGVNVKIDFNVKIRFGLLPEIVDNKNG